MEIPVGEGLQESSEWWSEMPDGLKKLTLAWLPAEKLCRYCLVCREWNALLSSTQFITNHWVTAPPNKKPWLVLFHDFYSLNSMVYCFFTETWKRLSLAFLEEQYNRNVNRFSVCASAAGLFLVSTTSFHLRGSEIHIVCNPLTEKSVELPRIDDDFIWAMTMIAEEGQRQNGDKYKVIAMARHLSMGVDTYKIYDSSLKSWSTARVVRYPQNLIPERTSKIVASGDFLYVKCVNGIVALNIQNGTSVSTPLPLEDVDDWSRNDVLFTCGSRVLLGSCISAFRPLQGSCISAFRVLLGSCIPAFRALQGSRMHGLNAIIISELDNSHSSMVRVTEIARMPLDILDSHRRDYANDCFRNLMTDFEGMRDLVFIRNRYCHGVLVYNLSRNTSTWLPERPRAPQPLGRYDSGGIFVFEPRPDKDVE